MTRPQPAAGLTGGHAPPKPPPGAERLREPASRPPSPPASPCPSPSPSLPGLPRYPRRGPPGGAAALPRRHKGKSSAASGHSGASLGSPSAPVAAARTMPEPVARVPLGRTDPPCPRQASGTHRGAASGAKGEPTPGLLCSTAPPPRDSRSRHAGQSVTERSARGAAAAREQSAARPRGLRRPPRGWGRGRAAPERGDLPDAALRVPGLGGRGAEPGPARSGRAAVANLGRLAPPRSPGSGPWGRGRLRALLRRQGDGERRPRADPPPLRCPRSAPPPPAGAEPLCRPFARPARSRRGRSPRPAGRETMRPCQRCARRPRPARPGPRSYGGS